MKRTLVILSLLTVSAVLILFSLDRLMGSPNRSVNGFNRKFIKRSWEKVAEFRLDRSFYSIAGADKRVIYLQTPKAGEILALNMIDNTVKRENIPVPPIEKFEPGFHTSVLYPEVFITGGNARKIVRGNLTTGYVEVFDIPTGPVLSTQIIDHENAIVRCIDTTKYQIEFRKINFAKGSLGAAVKMGDAAGEDIFVNDGVLSFDRKQNMLWYTNFYSNRISRFNTELGNMSRFKSVDTTNRPRVSVAHLEKSITYNKPPMTVNKQSFVYNGHLYVHSALVADNEILADPGFTVIDVYGPKYEGSFYIPVASGEFSQAIMLTDNKMAVLLKDKLAIFAME